ncbi:MAG TPA: LuxR C-terminal-related transcriptional regulator [Streptosporangiaceae bacterium]|jgi:LuxR family maltose regulon positive regulatory protein
MTTTTEKTAAAASKTAAAGKAAAAAPRLLEDKLQIPQPSLPLLRRRRLTDQIEQAAGHRVTLVSGPAGAGKTIACAAWAAATPASRRVAWLTLDAADGEPARCWGYVRAALARARALPADTLRELAGAAPEDFPFRLVEAAQRLTDPVVLILDDLHELAGGAVLPGLDELIRHAPAALRLILSGRCAPGLQLARLRVCGELADIGARDLACTPQEADGYFAMLGLALDPAERDELLRRTEGWMAGLRLAAMRAWSLPAQGSVTDIAGDEPIVTDYLWDEVLGRQPAEIRLFLLRTSVTEKVTGGLADELTGAGGGALTLDRISRESGLVDAVGTDQAEYRYHPLLRGALCAQLHRQIPSEVPILLRRAARWHAGNGQPAEAVRAAARAGDWDYAAHVLAGAGIAALLADGAAALEEALGLLPADRRADDAAVAAALATVRLWQGDTGSAAHHLEAARRGLDRCAQGDRRVIEPWLAAVAVMAAASAADPDPALLARAWALAEQAQASAGTLAGHRALGLLWYALGTARLRQWEIRLASYALDRADQQLAAAGLTVLRARAASWQAFADACYGELAKAGRTASGVLDSDGAGPGARCLAALAAAQVRLSRDELSAARQLLDQADQLAAGQLAAGQQAASQDGGRPGELAGGPVPGEPSFRALAGLVRARVLLANGDTAGARGLVISLRELHAAGDPALDGVLTVLDGEIALRSGDTGRARMLLALTDDGQYFDRADGRLAQGRMLLADGDFKGALEAVAPCLDGSAEAVTLRDKVAALLVSTVAHRRLGLTENAASFLDQALALAEPDDACRPFLDGGQPVRSAITVLVPPTSRSAAFAGRILERFDTQLPRVEGQQAPVEVPLTDSELAVLRFLPSHMTNQEIAEALFLSINTVKTHLRAVYRKLGVASRREAIARGKRLDLV